MNVVETLIERALAFPLNAGEQPSPFHGMVVPITNERTRYAQVLLTTERCGCLGETPLWHCSIVIRSTIVRSFQNREDQARRIAEELLDGRGEPRALWYWNADKRVGHLRTHATADEAALIPPSDALADDHDELGDWYERTPIHT